MLAHRITGLLGVAVIVGCATGGVSESVRLGSDNVSVVIARDAAVGKGPTGISDKFSLEGKIVAYMVFRWDDVDHIGGIQKIETRWYSGDKLITKRESEYSFTKPPYHVWTSIFPTSIGIGRARFEAYSNGVLLVSKTFEITDK